MMIITMINNTQMDIYNLWVMIINFIFVLCFTVINLVVVVRKNNHSTKVRWLQDLVKLHENTTEFYDSLDSLCTKHLESVEESKYRNFKIIDECKDMFFSNTIIYFEIFGNKLYSEALKHIEAFTDQLTKILLKEDENHKELIRKNKILFYKLILRHDIKNRLSK